MPIASLKLQPGVDVIKSALLNESGLAESNLIRFAPTASQTAIVQKMGGWQRFYANAISSPVRALHGWSDLNADAQLAIGATQMLGVVRDNYLYDVTPRTDRQVSVAVSVDTTSGSQTVAIDDTGSNVTASDSVIIRTPIAVGGLVLYGIYPITASVGANQFTITHPQRATATVSNGGAVPSFATVIDTTEITVTLAGHGLTPGDTVDFAVPTTVGGVTISGQYRVTTTPTSGTYTFNASQQATSTTSGSMNGGNAAYDYLIGLGPAADGTGFGVGGYGDGGYGTGVAGGSGNQGTQITATDWTLDNFGEILVACPDAGPIYQWSVNSATENARVMPYAPVINEGIFTAMPQRQIVAYGSTFNQTQDPLLVRWCDVENYDVWLGRATNQAGSYRLSSGSRIVGGLQAAGQGMLWTDISLWSMQYIGGLYVYGFKEIGRGCGLIAKKAAAPLAGTVYWMGTAQFYRLGANGVEALSCPIWDAVFQNINTAYLDNIRCGANSLFNEIIWFYPSVASVTGENDSYVKFNTALGIWDFGALGRSAWIDQSVCGNPIAASTTGMIYEHEKGYDDDGQPIRAMIQTGYFSVTEGQDKLFIDRIWPDMTWGTYSDADGGAQVQITFYCADYPVDEPTTYGPFTMSQAKQFLSVRFRARLVAMRIESSDVGSFWRLGLIRYRFQSAGRFY